MSLYLLAVLARADKIRATISTRAVGCSGKTSAVRRVRGRDLAEDHTVNLLHRESRAATFQTNQRIVELNLVTGRRTHHVFAGPQ